MYGFLKFSSLIEKFVPTLNITIKYAINAEEGL